MPGRGLDAEAAARRLTAATTALADWPGRPNVVPVTGGRDSRLVLAAALAAGLDFEGVTGGAPDEPDVRIGQKLCAAAGVPHSLLPADPHGNMWTDHRRAAEVVRLTGGGAATLADAAGFPLGPRDGPLPLVAQRPGRRDRPRLLRPERRARPRRAHRAAVRRVHRPPPAPARAALRRGPRDRRRPAARVGRSAARERRERRRRPRHVLRRSAHGAVGGTDARLRRVRARHHVAAVVAARDGRPARALAAPSARAPPTTAACSRCSPRSSRESSSRAAVAGTRARAASRAARSARREGRARGGAPRTRQRAQAAPAGAPAADPLDPILADVREQVLAAESHPAWDGPRPGPLRGAADAPGRLARRDEPLPRLAARDGVRRVATPSGRARTRAPGAGSRPSPSAGRARTPT